MFEEYPWPGNVRELRNTIEGAFNVAQGKYIHARDLTGYIVQQCGQHEKIHCHVALALMRGLPD